MFRRLLSALAAPAVVLLLCHAAGAQNLTLGPFNVYFVPSGQGFSFLGYGITWNYTATANWNPTQIADVAAAIQAWDNVIANGYGPRPINLYAVLDSNVPGGTSNESFYYDGAGTAYPYAEWVWRLGGSQSPAYNNNVDAVIALNSNAPWYYGGGPGSGWDFLSVVCHELGHCIAVTNMHLGFPNPGIWDPQGITQWDKQLRDAPSGGNQPAPGSAGIPSAFNVTANPCYWSGSAGNAEYSYYGTGTPVPIYAPPNYSWGGSLGHLDAQPQLASSIMSYAWTSQGPGQPSPLESAMMEDMGWIVVRPWTNNGTTPLTWGDPGNWSPRVVPTANSEASFTPQGLNPAGGDVVSLAAGGGAWTCYSLRIDGAPSFTIANDGTLTLAGGNITRTAATSGTQTIACPVILGANGIWDIAGSGQLVISAPVAGTFGLTKTGTGTVILSGANTYAGGTSITAGILQLGSAGAIPSGPGNVTIAGAGLLELNGFSPTIDGLSGTGIVNNSVPGATLTVGSNNATSSFSGVILGALGLTKIGGGTLSVTGASNTFSGGTTIAGGWLVAGNPGALGNTASNPRVELAGGNLRLLGAVVSPGLSGRYYQFSTLGGPGGPGGPSNDNGNNGWTLHDTLSNLNALNLLPPDLVASSTSGGQADFYFPQAADPFATQGWSGANPDRRSGYTVRWDGKIRIDSPGTYTFDLNSDDGSMIWIDGNQVVYNNYFQTMWNPGPQRTGSVYLTAGWHDIAISFYQGGGAHGLIARCDVTGSTIPIPNSILASSVYGTNDYGFNLVVSQDGSIDLDPLGGIFAVNTLGIADRTLRVTSGRGTTLRVSGLTTFNGPAAPSFDVAAGTILELAGGLNAGGYGLSKTGPGLLWLSGLGTNYALGGAVTIGGGNIYLRDGPPGFANSVTLGGNVVVPAGAGTVGVLAGTVNLNGSREFNIISANDRLLVGSTVAGTSGVLTKTGLGTMTLRSAGNTYGGGTVVQQGVLVCGTSTSLGSGNVTLAGGTLRLSNNAERGGLCGRYYSSATLTLPGLGPGVPAADNGNNGWIVFNSLGNLNSALDPLTPDVTAGTMSGGQRELNFPDTPSGACYSSQGFYEGAYYAVRFDGRLRIQNPGTYTFYTRSDDGSMLWIDGKQVVSNNYMQWMVERQGSINLNAGWHDIVIAHDDGWPGAGLEVSSDITGSKQFLSNDLLRTGIGSGSNDYVNSVILTADSTIELTERGTFNMDKLTISAPRTLTVTGEQGTLSFRGATALSASPNFLVDTAATLSFAGLVSGSGGLTKTGNGTLALTGGNAYQGNTTVTEGTLVFAPGADATVDVGPDATLIINPGAAVVLAGVKSSLSDATDYVDVTNNSDAPGLTVTGTNQAVGNIEGTGTTIIEAGAQLTASYIRQNALVLRGSSGRPASLCIRPSGSGALLVDRASPSPVPEPGVLWLCLLAVAASGLCLRARSLPTAAQAAPRSPPSGRAVRRGRKAPA